MFKTYFKIAWRNLLNHKGISSINIIGFSLGLTFTCVIGAYIWNELQVNRSLKNIDRQFMLHSQWKQSDMGPEIATLAPLAESLKQNYPNLVENYYRWDGISASVSKGDKHFREELQIGDASFLDMFGFKLKEGNSATAFKDPSSVVITAAAAAKYIGSGNAVGQVLSIENFSGERRDFFISAVMEETPYNSVTGLVNEGQAQIFLSEAAIPFFGRAALNDWNNAIIPSYITLKEGVSASDVEQAAKALILSHADPYFSGNMKPQLVPLKSYYLDANQGVVKNMLYTLFFISQFILLMALVNFINISVSASTRRIREIGVRKVLGGERRQLIGQFLAESVLLVLVSVLISLLIYQGSRSFFADVLGKPLYSLHQFPAMFFMLLLAAVIVIGLLAGLFPAVVLSSFKTIDSLKGKLTTASKNMLFRKVLVGFQFSIATFVLIGMFVISKQVSMFFGSSLGYTKDSVVSVAAPRNWSSEGVERMKTVRNEFKKLPQVLDATISYAIPDGRTGGSRQMIRSGNEHPVLINQLEADANYAATYGISMLAGAFLEDNADKTAVVINETAAKALGWNDPSDALGRQLIASEEEVYTITGITKDFHFASMKETIQPLCFMNLNAAPRYRFLSFKLKAGELSTGLGVLGKKWAELFPGAPFEYKLMDDSLAALYASEIRLRKAASTAAALSMVVVLLGIIGLVSISIQKRKKEIGIRKVLGSSAFAISRLFVTDFLAIGIVAALITCPLAWYVLQNWLNHYSYRITLTGTPFIASICLLLCIVVLMIMLQTLKTALSNPIKSLRTE